MPAFQPLDQALVWLRLRSRRKQREVAELAGVTQAMLSSYEKGHRVPTLSSLERILEALDADLPELHAALEVVRQARAHRAGGATLSARPTGTSPRRESLERVLDELRHSLARVSAEISAIDREKP